MKHRFRFLGTLSPDNHCWYITGDELEHLTKVLRLKISDEVEVFDGKGKSCIGEIIRLDKAEALIKSLQLSEEQEPQEVVALCLGALKKETFEKLLPSVTELNVSEIHVFTQKGTAKFHVDKKAIERWERIVLSSSKQSKRSFIPKIFTWKNHEALLKNFGLERFPHRFVLTPDVAETIFAPGEKVMGSLCLVIGSEKGLLPEETESFMKHAFKARSLGRNILTAFTAVIAAAALSSLHVQSQKER